jgi:hypothetical protein
LIAFGFCLGVCVREVDWQIMGLSLYNPPTPAQGELALAALLTVAGLPLPSFFQQPEHHQHYMHKQYQSQQQWQHKVNNLLWQYNMSKMCILMQQK